MKSNRRPVEPRRVKGEVITYRDRFGGSHRFLNLKMTRIAYRCGNRYKWEWVTIGQHEARD